MGEDYKKLIEDAKVGEIISRVLIGNAKLNYSKDGLRYDNEIIDAIMKAVAYQHWQRKVEELKAEEVKE